VDTALGGLFFLVNVGLYLELYGDFTQPLRPGIDLPLWDFVTLVGRDLLGGELVTQGGDPACPPALLADPVWELLADLAGREAGTPPGAGFDPPDAWRVPVGWLRPFGEGHAFGWSARAGRLLVRHPEGFVLVDVALEGDVTAQIAREVGPYAEARLGALGEEENGGAVTGAGPALDRWLGRLMPYVRARLSGALGVEAGEVGRLLCVLPAKVVLDAERVDIVIPLARLPIEVRLAGLDRDPGWVPGAGSAVAFHFE
jgi:hypothetical protein